MNKVFNMYQANIFIKDGAIVLGAGVSKGKAYIKFLEDDRFNELMKKWENREFEKSYY